MSRGQRLAVRILAPLAVLALAPLFLAYAVWVAGGRLADLAGQRRARRRR